VLRDPHFYRTGGSSLDLFYDEVMDHAQKLMQAGVFTELYVEPGVPHSCDSLAGIPQTERVAKMRDNATRRMLGIKEEPSPLSPFATLFVPFLSPRSDFYGENLHS